MSTTTTTTATPFVPEYLEYAGFRMFTVAEYHQMIKAGILTDGEPFELLEGYMVKKMSHGLPHDSGMDILEGLLPALLPSEWFVRCQRAITLTDSEPEPDYAIVRGPRNRYRSCHPTPLEIAILIEISDSSLRIDRTAKARIYARAGILVYWVVNVPDKIIEVYTQPSGPSEMPAYAHRDDYPVGSAVPVVIDAVAVGTIPVADIFE